MFIVLQLYRTQEGTEASLDYTEYQTLLKQGQIKEAEIKKSDLNNFDFHGTLKHAADMPVPNGKAVRGEKFVVTLPYIDGTVIKEWNDQGINFKITKMITPG